MTEKRNEFMQRIDAREERDASNVFMAARVESERIEAQKNKVKPMDGDKIYAAMQSSSSTRWKLATAQKENEEAKAALRGENKDLSSADAVFAAMETSATLRKKLEDAEKDIEDSKKFIRGER